MKSVPPSATSKSPRPSFVAPVKAPATCPKSSFSRRDSERAPQLIATYAFSRRGDALWIARAARVLARPALALDEDGGGRARDLEDQLADALDRGVSADDLDAFARPRARELVLEVAVLAREAPLFASVRQVDLELGELDRLREVVEGPELHGLDRRLDAPVSREDDRLERRAPVAELLQALDPGHPREARSRSATSGVELGGPREGLLARAHGDDLVAAPGDLALEEVAVGLLVLDQEHARVGRAFGRARAGRLRGSSRRGSRRGRKGQAWGLRAL